MSRRRRAGRRPGSGRSVPSDLERRRRLKPARTIAGLRSRSLSASGNKVLIVLDQFEQWLHAEQPRENADDELVRALRQCDGANVQCLVLVRDDFAMAAARFMRVLEIRLVESDNFATVDPFDLVHAEGVRAFGVAYDRFEGDDEIGAHERFLDHAVAELAEDGKIAPVRSALFTQMIKDKPWTPPTLKEVGGLEGIGVNFPRRIVGRPSREPRAPAPRAGCRQVLTGALAAGCRRHQGSHAVLRRAARGVGIFSSAGRLRHAADDPGHGAPADHADRSPRPWLEDAEQTCAPADRYYHLTHDYLVPSLREWINKNETTTIGGRMAIRLTERTAEWSASLSRRYLPSWWEWLAILLFTRRSRRSPAERRMMGAASVYHTVRLAMVAAAAIVICLAVSNWLGSLNCARCCARVRECRGT